MILSEDEKEQMETYVRSIKDNIDDREQATKRPKKYGICGMCSFFHYYLTIYDKENACCGKLKKPLSSMDRIKYCIDFKDFSLPSLYDMMNMAVIIDPNKPGRIGY